MSQLLDKKLLSYYIKTLTENEKYGDFLTIICDDIEKTFQELEFFLPKVKILKLEELDVEPYSRISPSLQVQSNRLFISNYLDNVILKSHNSNKNKTVLVTSLKALSAKLLTKNSKSFDINKNITYKQLSEKLLEFGFNRTSNVTELGDYSIRGDVIDIGALTDFYRITFFDDELETIYHFDEKTQRTLEKCENASITQIKELIINDENKHTFYKNYVNEFEGANQDILYFNIKDDIEDDRVYHFLPLFQQGETTSFFDKIINIGHVILFDDYKNKCLDLEGYYDSAYSSRLEFLDSNFSEKKDPFRAIKPNKQYLFGKTLLDIISKLNKIELSELSTDETKNTSIKTILFDQTNRLKSFNDFLNNYIDKKYTINISSVNEKTQERFERIITESNFDKYENLNLIISPLEQGFEDSKNKIIYITNQDVFGKSHKAYKKQARKAKDIIKDFSEIENNSLIVHEEHGIGRFLGLKTIKDEEFLEILYDNADKLYVPVVNLDRISRYSISDESTVSLDCLGSPAFEKRKAKVKKDLLEIADELIKIAAYRDTKKGTAFENQGVLYDEFCETFDYELTPEQSRTMNEVEQDLYNSSPMDRLVVGDVGFGKTEIAMRAAFIASLGGSQVAIVCPTTLLAKQHFNLFKKRLEPFSINVAHISGLVSLKDRKIAQNNLKNGSIDVVVGTHALLSKNIEFKNLGLLVIDEEQRFGVTHKEHLKTYKDTVDVLSLTATPIPRTLQMAVSGIKGLSTITTPPVDRVAVKTFICQFDGKTIKDAILKEVSRGGQVYFVTPKVKNITHILERLQKLMPNIKFAVAHGKIPKSELDDIMLDFYDGKIDVLLATTIVESGLDVPNANTVIINEPQHFGLSQMYQIRGRVGRSATKAYAYILLPELGKLPESALKRIKLLQRMEDVGSGFLLASYDLDERGSGNILGKSQSGHIREIGFSLYSKMLSEAVKIAKRRQDKKDIRNGLKSELEIKEYEKQNKQNLNPTLHLGTIYKIPETYITDYKERLKLYRRLNELEDEEDQNDLKLEIKERFGKNIPDELETLFLVINLKRLCVDLNIEEINAGQNGAVIKFYENAPPNPAELVKFISENSLILKIRPDSSILIKKDLNTGIHRVIMLNKFLYNLKKVIV